METMQECKKDAKRHNLTRKQVRYLSVKRAIDVILSGSAIVILSPLLAVISLAIKLESPGPVLFRQERVGKDNKIFEIWKFRSMYTDTPKDTPTHMLSDPEQYITKTGKFIRKTSLDELPQIFNIFKGQMSIVGPRPALWNQYDLIEERDKYGVNDIMPGLTGWAQINGRDELEISVKAKLDSEYVKKMGFWMDVKCFLGTIGSVLNREGVVEGGTGEIRKRGNTKKIAVLSSHTPSLFWFRMDMMKHFQELGYEVIAIGNEAEKEWKDRFLKKGIYYYAAEISRNGTNPLNDMKTLSSLVSILKKEMPDKIFAYQAKTVVYGSIAGKLVRIQEIYPLIAGIGSVFLADGFKTKILRFILTAEYRLAIRKCPKVFFQNVDDVKVFQKYHIVKKEQVAMTHGSGVNLEIFQVQKLPEKPAFLCISRLIRDKGVYEYLEACRKIKKYYPEVRCLLVGPFDSNPSALQENELNEFIIDGSIEYFGEQADVRPYLGQTSVFVLPSYREGTPKTVLEAMASGRAIITTDVPGCRETVVDGKNGFLVAAQDVESIVDKMRFFIERPDKIQEMASIGRKMAEELFDVKKVNESIANTMKL